MNISAKKVVFDDYYFRKICDSTIRGLTLKKIAETDEMLTAGILYSWTKKYPVLKNAIRVMKESRCAFRFEMKLNDKLNSDTQYFSSFDFG